MLKPLPACALGGRRRSKANGALESADLHVARVAARVRRGGHDIPESKIRDRHDDSRRNLVRLLPHIEGLRAYDNSEESAAPVPRLVLQMRARCIAQVEIETAPNWARPIIAAALALDSRFQILRR